MLRSKLKTSVLNNVSIWLKLFFFFIFKCTFGSLKRREIVGWSGILLLVSTIPILTIIFFFYHWERIVNYRWRLRVHMHISSRVNRDVCNAVNYKFKNNVGVSRRSARTTSLRACGGGESEGKARVHQSVGSDMVSPGAAAGSDGQAEVRTRRARSRRIVVVSSDGSFVDVNATAMMVTTSYRHAKNVCEHVRERG